MSQGCQRCCRLEALDRLSVRPNVTALVSVQDAAYQDYLAHLDGFAIEWWSNMMSRRLMSDWRN